MDFIEETVVDKSRDLLKRGGDLVVKRGNFAVTATELTAELAEQTVTDNLEHVRSIDGEGVDPNRGDRVGGTPSVTAVQDAAADKTTWQRTDGLWYSHPAPTFVPQSPTEVLYRPTGNGDISIEHGNERPDTRPDDHALKSAGKVLGNAMLDGGMGRLLEKPKSTDHPMRSSDQSELHRCRLQARAAAVS